MRRRYRHRLSGLFSAVCVITLLVSSVQATNRQRAGELDHIASDLDVYSLREIASDVLSAAHSYVRPWTEHMQRAYAFAYDGERTPDIDTLDLAEHELRELVGALDAIDSALSLINQAERSFYTFAARAYPDGHRAAGYESAYEADKDLQRQFDRLIAMKPGLLDSQRALQRVYEHHANDVIISAGKHFTFGLFNDWLSEYAENYGAARVHTAGTISSLVAAQKLVNNHPVAGTHTPWQTLKPITLRDIRSAGPRTRTDRIRAWCTHIQQRRAQQ